VLQASGWDIHSGMDGCITILSKNKNSCWKMIMEIASNFLPYTCGVDFVLLLVLCFQYGVLKKRLEDEISTVVWTVA